MRPSLAVFLLACSSFIGAQTGEPKPREKNPVTTEKYDFPRVIEMGQEFTLTVQLKNGSDRLALANARLHLTGACEILAPAAEQTVLLEAGSQRSVSWRLKRVGGGKISFFVPPYLLTDKRGAGTAVPERENVVLEKIWHGEFTSPGHVYEAKMTLRVDSDGAAEGRIRWTLKKSDRPEYKDKVGSAGIEFVWGGYDAKKRELVIEGYRRDDPHEVLGLDKYKLVLGKNNDSLSGTTWTHGTREGRLNFTQAE